MLTRNTDKEIEAYISSSEYVSLKVKESRIELKSLQEDSRAFTYERYAEEIHPPVKVDGINCSLLDADYARCLDMPIRLSGQEDYRLPIEWSRLSNLLEDIIAVEHSHNSNWRDYNVYLTIDCKEMKVSEQQRHGGLHVDGFQGERIQKKTKINRNYVATTNGGTVFYPQRFIVADPKDFNVFQGFDLQAEKPLIAEAEKIYFMDAYTVHESGFAQFDGRRTFIRLTYDVKIFDRLGNTHNSSLDYNWDMLERSTQKDVRRPKLTDIEKSPYFPNPNS